MPSRLGTSLVLLPLLAVLCTVGCEGAPSAPTTVLFELPGDPQQDLFALPYPNDLRTRADGSIELARLSAGQTALVQRYLDDVAKNPLGGYATNGACFFRFNRPIDAASLPATPLATMAADASVYLVNIDQQSRDYGRRVPLRVRFREAAGRFIGDNSLAALPVAGFPLAPKTTYAAIVTENVMDRLGRSVRPARDFATLLTATKVPPRLDRARSIYRPLREFIEVRGLTGIAAAAVFTTGDPLVYARRARQVVARLPAPVAEDVEVAAETDNYFELRGRYRTPLFQQGESPYLDNGGDIALNVAGEPTITGYLSLRFSVVIPKGAAPPAGWPLVLYAHGTGGDYRSYIRAGVAKAVSRVSADAGGVMGRMAMASIDQVYHGEREIGDDAAGFFFFNPANPQAAVGNVLQAAFDNFTLLRLLQGLSLHRVPWSAAAGKEGAVEFGGISFDSGRVSVMGHSQGALTLPPFIAYEPEIRAAVLSAGGAVAMLSLLNKTEPLDVPHLLQVALREQVDAFHPLMTMLQHLLESADPVNYAPLFAKRSPTGTAKHLLITEGIVDHFTPLETSDALATAAGVPVVGRVLREIPAQALAGLPSIALPTAGNVAAGSSTVSGGLLQYRGLSLSTDCQADTDCGTNGSVYCDLSSGEGLCRRDGHFVVFDVAAAVRQYSHFLVTTSRDGMPTFVTPRP